MRKVLVTAATFWPMEIEAIKVRPELHITGTASDLIILDHLQSAIEAFEEYTNNILRLSTWDLYLDAFPAGEIEMPGPLSSVTSISYLDSAGASQTLASTIYAIDATGYLFGRIALKNGQSWPSAYDEINAVTIRFLAGYANAAAIPQRIKDGLVAKIQELFYGVDMSEAYENCWRNYRRIPI